VGGLYGLALRKCKIMKKKYCLIIVGLAISSLTVNAQQINTDSLNHVSKISEYQLKRAKLQNTVDQTTRDKQDAASTVQNSADKSSQDASRLSSDPENKSLARKADNAASDAQRDSRRSRKANEKLDDLNKQISKLDTQIADEQSKLNVYKGNVAPPAVVPLAVDSSRHF
jgi:chromosome segregation ATPase